MDDGLMAVMNVGVEERRRWGCAPGFRPIDTSIICTANSLKAPPLAAEASRWRMPCCTATATRFDEQLVESASPFTFS